MDHAVVVTKALARGFAGRDTADERLVERILHDHLVDIDGAASCLLVCFKRVEWRKRVRPKLDTGTDFAKMRRLRKHLH